MVADDGVAAAEETCRHHWLLDAQSLGRCKKCGDVRQFPTSIRSAKMLMVAPHIYTRIRGENNGDVWEAMRQAGLDPRKGGVNAFH